MAKILVIDDMIVNLRIAVAVFSKLGHEVSSCLSGTEGIDLVSRQSFDLIFMDCHMPDLNGYHTTQLLRLQGFRAPIIALSSIDENIHWGECAKAGMDFVMTKPLRLLDAETVISRFSKDLTAPNLKDAQAMIEGFPIVDEVRLAKLFAALTTKQIDDQIDSFLVESKQLLSAMFKALDSNGIDAAYDCYTKIKNCSELFAAKRFPVLVGEISGAIESNREIMSAWKSVIADERAALIDYLMKKWHSQTASVQERA